METLKKNYKISIKPARLLVPVVTVLIIAFLAYQLGLDYKVNILLSIVSGLIAYSTTV